MMAAPNITNIDVSLAARQYVAQGWVLVPIARGSKGPRTEGWNLIANCITNTDQCGRVRDNVGLALAYSRMCTLDLDNLELARRYMQGRRIDLDELLGAADAVRISSGRPNRAKLLYRLPAGVAPLASKQLKAEGFELRCATVDGRTLQDVLPPSIHPETNEPYTWDYPEPLIGHWSIPPTLPTELLALWQELIKPVEREVNEKAPLGLGKRELRELLKQYDPSTGYQEWVELGMALHHETRGGELGLDLWDEWSSTGVTYKGREDLAQHWDSFGKRSTGPMKTVRSLLSTMGITADDFEDLTLLDAQTEAPKRPRFAVLAADEFAHSEPMRWLIKGYLPRAQLAILYGESTAGKTFATLDMVLAIARGEAWRDRKVVQGRVAYVVAEGQGGFRKRLQAYARHHGVDLGALPFGVIADAPNLLVHDDKLIAAQVIAWGGADVIVIDTLAQATPGANENSGEDMGKALAHCRRLHEATGALILLVHHSGKDTARGARGWSGLKGAADTEIEVLREGDQRTLRFSKQKDGEESSELPFNLLPVVLGLDEDGEDITSCVVQTAQSVPKHERRVEPKGNVQKIVVRVMHDLMGFEGAEGRVLHTDLIEHAVNQLLAPEPGKRDARRQHVMRAIETLVAGNVLRVEGQEVVLC